MFEVQQKCFNGKELAMGKAMAEHHNRPEERLWDGVIRVLMSIGSYIQCRVRQRGIHRLGNAYLPLLH